jgi:hypothetical protein
MVHGVAELWAVEEQAVTPVKGLRRVRLKVVSPLGPSNLCGPGDALGLLVSEATGQADSGDGAALA